MDERRRQAQLLLARLQHHPRIEYQRWAAAETARAKLAETVPLFVPFGGARYCGMVPILDWDHRLPSRHALLRVYAYYDEEQLRVGVAALNKRHAEIKAADIFPEFDAPDFAGLHANECYEGEVGEDGAVRQMRLTSEWRREIEPDIGQTAVAIVRRSTQYRDALAKQGPRPDYLGELEAVAWTPPCESTHELWTIDCWYLLHLDAVVGRGRSYLVDVGARRVVGQREFVVRAG